MRLASFVISFCLHAGFVLLVLFWPAPAPHRPLPQPISVSLVDGLPGGNRAPTPMLNPQGAPARKEAPPLPSAPSKEKLPPAPVEPVTTPIPAPIRETPPPKLEPPKPVPQPVAEQDAALLADKKTEEPKKPEAPKEDPKPAPPRPDPVKPAPPKEEAKKPEAPKPTPPRRNPAEEALAKLRAQAKTTPGELRVKPNAVTRALAAARRESGGHDGGGGGEGDGEGGGGIGDVYAAQIVMAVQPNWHWPAQAQGSLSVALYLKIDAAGRVLDVRVDESSGNAIFDSSAVSAVRVTQVLPPPPNPAYREIVLRFFPMQ